MTNAAKQSDSNSDFRKKSARDRKLANTVGAALLIVLVGGLALIPSVVRQKEYVFPSAKHDTPAPFPMDKTLAFHNEDGLVEETTLRELIGTYPSLIVNLWATWCPPCIDELPSLEYLHRQLQGLPSGPRLVTISVDENYRDVNELFRTLKFKPTFGVLHDSEAFISSSVGTFKFPETYWIDRDGKILHKWVGPQDWMGERVLRQLQQRLSTNN